MRLHQLFFTYCKRMNFHQIQKYVPYTIYNLLRDTRNKLRKKIDGYKIYVSETNGKNGLEIGGPSYIFKYQLPIYNNCKSLEFANFSSETIWEGELTSNVNYISNKIGMQHVADATDLSKFTDNQFDFILSSNCLEHVANPLKALSEWKRVSAKSIILILPRKNYNFDHKRPITKFEHIVSDFVNNTDESDLTHLDEVLENHDLSLDPPAGTFEQFKQRSLNNQENRGMHHHVYDNNLVEKMCDYLDLKIIKQTFTSIDWIFLIQKEKKNAGS